MIQSTLLPQFDAFNRVLACRDTFLTQIVREAMALAVYDPLIPKYLQDDIECRAREAKKVRLMDEIYHDEQLDRFPAFENMLGPADFDLVDSRSFDLADGRPRAVDAELLLVLTVINGVISLTSRDGYDRLVESEVFGAVIDSKWLGMPARSTVGKYLQITSERTLNCIHKALYRKAQEDDLDDFSELTVDSTGI